MSPQTLHALTELFNERYVGQPVQSKGNNMVAPAIIELTKTAKDAGYSLHLKHLENDETPEHTGPKNSITVIASPDAKGTPRLRTPLIVR